MTTEKSLSHPAPPALVSERRQILDSGAVRGVLLRARSLGPFVFLLLLVALFTALSPRFLLLSNITTVLFTAAILTIASLAQALVMFTRNLDLSIGAVMAGAGDIPTLIYTHTHACAPFLSPAAVVIGASFGLINCALGD